MLVVWLVNPPSAFIGQLGPASSSALSLATSHIPRHRPLQILRCHPLLIQCCHPLHIQHCHLPHIQSRHSLHIPRCHPLLIPRRHPHHNPRRHSRGSEVALRVLACFNLLHQSKQISASELLTSLPAAQKNIKPTKNF